ncbi:MAG: 50S ribosomal protein L3 [Candidatus Eremiobacteraeota bacterium]|nr:50S ribosomal protein L3 [Candidatus Eremiobacteraeota bacterium]
MKGLLGKKLGMTSIFSPEGNRIPITVIQAGPCTVTDIRTENKNGYNAVQLGYEIAKKKRMKRTVEGKKKNVKRFKKPIKGQFDRFNIQPMEHLKEMRVASTEEYTPGQEIKVDIFKEGEKVDVIGTSIGKGFAGAMKRWNFGGGCSSHGSQVHRQPGSAGATDAARTFKGKKSPGHMGNKSSAALNLEVVKIIPDKNLILIKGAIPGSKQSLVFVRETVKRKMKKKHKIKGTAAVQKKATAAKGKKTIKKKIK